MSPLNECSACGHDFTSIALFDHHRVGKHAYDYSPERSDGRRCLDIEEMEAKGWKQSERRAWFDPLRVKRAHEAFAKAS